MWYPLGYLTDTSNLTHLRPCGLTRFRPRLRLMPVNLHFLYFFPLLVTGFPMAWPKVLESFGTPLSHFVSNLLAYPFSLIAKMYSVAHPFLIRSPAASF